MSKRYTQTMTFKNGHLFSQKRCFIIMTLFGFGVFIYYLNLSPMLEIVKVVTSACSQSAAIADKLYKYSNDVTAQPAQPFDIGRVYGSTYLNLMEDYSTSFPKDKGTICTEEWMNEKKLPQDHPCVIDIIRRKYLYPPAAPEVPYYLHEPNATDRSAGQAKRMLEFLKQREGGFFVECGALDGENLSNTLMMERFYNWRGILIEADQHSFGRLLSLRRKAHSLPVCLSIEAFPTKVAFQVKYGGGSIKEDLRPPTSDMNGKAESISEFIPKTLLSIQCFPLYSILLAVGETKVDFFSLDVEGHEVKILKTVPWNKVDVETFTLEWNHVGRESLIKYMAEIGYYVFGENTGDDHGPDLFFAKNGTL